VRCVEVKETNKMVGQDRLALDSTHDMREGGDIVLLHYVGRCWPLALLAGTIFLYYHNMLPPSYMSYHPGEYLIIVRGDGEGRG
jgi:hypothetical protein